MGLPSKDPWSLPFGHKKVFAERLERYDLFVYSEDDILITERNLRAFLDASATLRVDEIVGFFRIEHGSNGSVNYPDVHAHFHWDVNSIRLRGKYALAKFTNEHAGCYVLTKSQLTKAIKSGGFLVGPHQWRYHLPETAATDPYTQCGYTKLIPISHLDDFIVEHLPNKYAGKMGVGGPELQAQVCAMLQLVGNAVEPMPLLNAETKLWRGLYSKDFYEPCCEKVFSLIPPETRSVLSIGCGSGATECRLVERDLRVVAVPLDPVICGSAAARGVEMVFGDFSKVREKLKDERFDCLLCLNVLHLARDPAEVLSLFREVLATESVVIIQTPNMLFTSTIVRRICYAGRYHGLGKYELTGVHLSSVRGVRTWCRNAGLKVDRIVGNLHRRADFLRGFSAGLIALCMSPSFVCVAKKIASSGDSSA